MILNGMVGWIMVDGSVILWFGVGDFGSDEYVMLPITEGSPYEAK
jgi:hypothetical protein